MQKLESYELHCLQAIARGLHGESGICSMPVLAQLRAKGLITTAPALRVPLEWLHPNYTLTEAGKEALRSVSE